MFIHTALASYVCPCCGATVKSTVVVPAQQMFSIQAVAFAEANGHAVTLSGVQWYAWCGSDTRRRKLYPVALAVRDKVVVGAGP